MPHTTTQPTMYEREMRFRALLLESVAAALRGERDGARAVLLERLAAEYDGEAMEAQWRRTAPEREQVPLPLDRADAELASNGLVRVGEEDWPESIGAVVCSRFYTAAEYERAVRAKRETGDVRAVPVDGNEGA